MKTGRTLQELAVELDRQAAAKRDFVVSSRRMGMTESASHFRLLPEDSDILNFDMNDLFHRQVGASLGIPAKYYDMMREKYPSLLAQNVNGWFEREPSKHTVRTLDGTARAFLSDRYRRIDNYDIAKATLPVISEMPGVRVESCEITGNRLYLKVVNSRLAAEITKGDVVQAGIIISNSEVGLGSVSVMPLVYRLVCLNGMIINELGKAERTLKRYQKSALSKIERFMVGQKDILDFPSV